MLKVLMAFFSILLCTRAARADAGQDCMQDSDKERQIQGCTEYINQNNGSEQQLALAHYMRGMAYLKQSRVRDAKDDFDQAIALSYQNHEKASLDYDRAIELIAATIASEPNPELERIAESLRQHRDCERDVGLRIKGCTDLLSHSQNGGRDVVFAYVNLGAAYEEAGEYSEALANFNQAIALNSKFLSAYLYRADLYQLEDQYQNAAQDLESAAELMESITKERPDPRRIEATKKLRNQIGTLNSYGKLEARWIEYLKEIQAVGDWSNWSQKPYDLYLRNHSATENPTAQAASRNDRRSPTSVSPSAALEEPGPQSSGGDFASRYGWYVEAVRRAVAQNWMQSTIDPAVRASHRAHCTATFTVLRDGTIKNIRLAQSSGNRSFDTSALFALLSTGGFPPLPSDYTYTQVDITYDFDLDLTR